MGSGKSTYGAEAAAMLGLPFLDLDTEIERSAGMGISDIFREKGEAAFREMERDTLRALASRDSSVIATGGGTPCFHGNMDFMNMLQRSRLESKKISKTRAVTSVVPHEMDDYNVHIGPSDYVAWLDDRKFAFVRLEGTTFGDVPLNLEYKLEVWDSPNSAGIVIDAVRAAKIALDRGLAGPVLAPSSYFMKSPAVQHEDNEARELVERFIAGEVEADEAQLDADVAAAKAAGKDVWRA